VDEHDFVGCPGLQRHTFKRTRKRPLGVERRDNYRNRGQDFPSAPPARNLANMNCAGNSANILPTDAFQSNVTAVVFAPQSNTPTRSSCAGLYLPDSSAPIAAAPPGSATRRSTSQMVRWA